MFRYLATFATQTLLVIALGLVWLGNSILVGGIGHADPIRMACGVGFLNHTAATWSAFAVYGFPATAILVFAFGFIASWATNGVRSIYTYFIFVAPVFGLVAQNATSWTNSPLIYLGSFTSFGVIAFLVAVVYWPGYYYHRRLTSR